MKLIIDIGNTQAKLAVFEGRQLVSLFSLKNLDPKDIKKIKTKIPSLQSAILCSVIKHKQELIKYLKLNFEFIELHSKISVPIKNLYNTPTILGSDRLAAVVGASDLFPNENVLVIDAGTCIKYDFINKKNEYLGGGISPGLNMRFKALNTFTGKLPLVRQKNKFELIGNSTERSVLSGVLNGVVAEVDGIIGYYKKLYPDTKVIITGGDRVFFDKRLKSNTFAAPNLVLQGLNIILEYNVR